MTKTAPGSPRVRPSTEAHGLLLVQLYLERLVLGRVFRLARPARPDLFGDDDHENISL
ncbi:MAG: hypothetical protein LBT86_04645 [Deltaproteobacteria bacterium]|nr:hypothetical protein [Deltaproteobacteria bacterium]